VTKCFYRRKAGNEIAAGEEKALKDQKQDRTFICWWLQDFTFYIFRSIETICYILKNMMMLQVFLF